MKNDQLPTTAQMDRWAIKNADKLESQDQRQWRKVQEMVREFMVDPDAFLACVANMEISEREIREIFESLWEDGRIDQADCNLAIYQLCQKRSAFLNEIRGEFKDLKLQAHGKRKHR